MITEEELERTAALLRDALRAAHDLMPQLAPASDLAPARSRRLKGARTWLIPLAAAACVIGVIAVSMLVTMNLPGHSPTRTTTAPPAMHPPEYYVTSSTASMGLPGPTFRNVQRLQVRRTSTGQVTGSLVTNGHWSGGYTQIVAASDQTFYIAQGDVTCKTTLYRLTISGSGRITAMTRIGPVLRTSILGMAASPDGRRLAYLASPECVQIPDAHLEVTVLDLNSGVTRTWPSAHLMSSFTPLSQLSTTIVSWMPDNRTLVLANESAVSPMRSVLGLDTASKARTFQAASRVLWSLPPCSTTLCVSEVLAGPTENTLTSLEIKAINGITLVDNVTLAKTGPVPYVAFSSQTRQGQPLSAILHADPSGRYLLLTVGERTGWIDDGSLRSLPVLGSPLAIAW
jgi:hypothetical protein